MVDVEPGRFTVGVFQDVASAQKGIEALKAIGIQTDWLSIITKDTPDAAALIQQALGAAGDHLEIPDAGAVLARGPIIAPLQGTACDLAKVGIAGAMRRVGFQQHDGRIFEALTARGGVLVAILNEPRAADALAILFSYGGGNAAIGAWTGRV
jgi:hypothetical protein